MVTYHIFDNDAIAINLRHEYNYFRTYSRCFYALIIKIACSECLVVIAKIDHTSKAIYNRLVAKGKRKKLALIAIAKPGLTYDNKYRSTLVKS